MKLLTSLLVLLCPAVLLATDPSPYAGEELRSIKSLSKEEIESLRLGSGMGFAKLAELNHFPGPKHVLEVAEQIELSATQREATEALFQEMRQAAIALGEELVLAEMNLDRAFATSTITEEQLQAALLDIGRLQARLRFVHLEAHLRQNRLLTADQVRRYDAVRGYGDAGHTRHEH